MGVPNIDVIAYPLVPVGSPRAMYYLEMGRASSVAKPLCQISPQVWVRNQEKATLHWVKAELIFANPALNQTITFPKAMDIKPAESATWYATNSQYVICPAPPPQSFTLRLTFTGFSPWSDTIKLERFDGDYAWPGKLVDLGANEFWIAEGATHAGGGDQIYHYDVGISGWDATKGQWSDTYPGTNGSQNQHHRIWNRPVYAIADGEVTFSSEGVTDNPAPGIVTDENQKKGYGNAFNIQHGTYLGIYMHMKKGTLDPNLLKISAKVQAGQLLGHAGNTGTSSHPHLHFGIVDKDAQGQQFSMPLPVAGAHALQDSLLDPNHVEKGLWTELNRQGPPHIEDGSRAMIWPGSTWPPFRVPAVGIVISGDWTNLFWTSDSIDAFLKKVQDYEQQGYHLVYANWFMENGFRRWAGIARTGNWHAKFWVSADLASFSNAVQSQFDQDGMRLIHAVSFVENGKTKWAGISRSANWAVNTWVSPDLDDLKKTTSQKDSAGRKLVCAAPFLVGNQQRWFAIAQSGDWENTLTESPNFGAFSSDVQGLFDKKGQRLMYATSYVQGGARRWLGISRAGTWANNFWQSPDLDDLRSKISSYHRIGRLLIGVEFL